MEETRGGKWLCRRTEPLPTLYRYASALTHPTCYMEETGGGNPKAHVECNIPCCPARWPCIPELLLPIGSAGIYPIMYKFLKGIFEE